MMHSSNQQTPSSESSDLEMDFLDYALGHEFGEIHCKVDPETGMKAIIAIHNTQLGPALGGCRFIEYSNTHQAIYDAMRLARGMTFKSALARLPLGGGKAVIIKPHGPFNRDAYFHRFGEFVNELNGRYITAVDSGTQLSDMDIIAQHTPYVASLTSHHGDPSLATARGVLRGIEAAVSYKLGRDSLKNMHIAIQGLGHVGMLLVQYLTESGAQVSVADTDQNRVDHAVKTFGAKVILPEHIHKIACDVFVPCALGGIIHHISVHELQTSIIAGAANNQLAHPLHGHTLHQKDILYAPDYVINAGGVIFASSKYFGLPESGVNDKVDAIHQSLIDIFRRSNLENRPTSEIADLMAIEYLQA